MRAIFGAAFLLIALAIVGLLASKQLREVERASAPTVPLAAVAAATGSASAPVPSAAVSMSSNAASAEPNRKLPEKIANDLDKLVNESDARLQDIDK